MDRRRHPRGERVAQLVIPSLGVEEIVVEGTSATQGPATCARHLFQVEAGNAVLAGRRASTAPFRHLDQLGRGDVIVVTTGQGVSRYWVTDVAEVGRDQDDVVDPTVTVDANTSTPVLRADHRLVVTADLRSKPLQTACASPGRAAYRRARPAATGPGASGWCSWLEALALAMLDAVLLRRRMGRWAAYLLMAPVVALLVLLVFDSLTPVLPSTL